MAVPLIVLGWALLLVLVLALCRAAARSDIEIVQPASDRAEQRRVEAPQARRTAGDGAGGPRVGLDAPRVRRGGHARALHAQAPFTKSLRRRAGLRRA
jgi:hypothetical protein